MTAAINIQCAPSPEIWHASGPVVPYTIISEEGDVIVGEDETGQASDEITEG